MDCSHDSVRRQKCSRSHSCLPLFRQRSFLGVLLIAAGALVMLLFVPTWLIAILLAFFLFALGFWMLGCR